ncbi:ACP S-malonyltransferase [bacterium]|nr:ACP S-malonyltransferase [candidate division CSSED10-310 bacterium]
MGRDFFETYPVAADIFTRADKVLGFPLSDLCFNGPQDQLNLTANTQPALLTVSAAIAAVFRDTTSVTPLFAAGHSLGEYTALWFAGSLDFESAVRLVRIRGEAMQNATPTGMGTMAALIGLNPDAIADVCKEAAQDQVLQAANFNSPGQIVISGHREAVERGILAAQKHGAKKGVILPVSAPFHSRLMEPAALRMKSELDRVTVLPPATAIVNNADARVLDGHPDSIRSSLVRQVISPVKWEQSLQYMANRGVELFVELGPGNILTNLVKRTIPQSMRVSIGTVEGLGEFIRNMASC